MPYQQYPLVTDQTVVPYYDAFADTGEESAQTQSAVLLGLGALLTETPERAEPKGATRETAEPFPQEDWSAIAAPETLAELRDRRGGAYELDAVREKLDPGRVRRLEEARDFRQIEAVERFVDTQASLSGQLATAPSADLAVQLIANSLNHPQPLVRVAAASSGLQLFPGEQDQQQLLEPVTEALDNEDDLLRELAATVLARVAPDHPLLARLLPPGTGEAASEPQHTALIVHGTFARGGSWWQPGGDFHSYLLNDVRPDLYSQSDRFDWSGGYSDAARSIGAEQLEDWVAQRSLNGLDLFCHSHGGSIAMSASHAGLQINKLVLLSCPVHRARYLPNFSQVNEAVSVRVKFDLVILADGGGQRYRPADGIRENRLPIWFNHSATHDPDVWRDHDVPSLI